MVGSESNLHLAQTSGFHPSRGCFDLDTGPGWSNCCLTPATAEAAKPTTEASATKVFSAEPVDIAAHEEVEFLRRLLCHARANELAHHSCIAPGSFAGRWQGGCGLDAQELQLPHGIIFGVGQFSLTGRPAPKSIRVHFRNQCDASSRHRFDGTP